MLRISFFLFPFYLIFLGACGAPKEVHNKDYRLYFETEDPALQEEAERLIHHFNQDVGFQALTYMPSAEGSNSLVSFREGLRASEGKLGYGQWVTHSSTSSLEKRLFSGGKTEVEYSMALELDQDFVENRAGLATSDPEWCRLYILFCHEVGHGLQMDHHTDRQSVMYPVINSCDGLDFSKFFKDVNAFFVN